MLMCDRFKLARKAARKQERESKKRRREEYFSKANGTYPAFLIVLMRKETPQRDDV